MTEPVGLPAIVPGLCSVTLRSLDIPTVVRHAADNQLQAIEWGADVHVPPGDAAAARAARAACDDHGVAVASYGSYLAAGRLGDAGEVHSVLDTAVELGAPNVRVWAHDSEAATDLAVICAAAASRDLAVSVEFHPGTRTETASSANELLDEVQADNLYTYWQPDPTLSPTQAVAELEAVLPRVSHLHVFWWLPDYTRLPLAEGFDLWPEALSVAAPSRAPLVPRIAFLEFVPDEDPAALRADAATLRRWLDRLRRS